jgi:hypothetical protein
MGKCTFLTGQAAVLVDDAFSRRIRDLACRVGNVEAMRLLGVGRATYGAARERGRMAITTRDRLITALDQIEKEVARVG